jgi:hypothetical protein
MHRRNDPQPSGTVTGPVTLGCTRSYSLPAFPPGLLLVPGATWPVGLQAPLRSDRPHCEIPWFGHFAIARSEVFGVAHSGIHARFLTVGEAVNSSRRRMIEDHYDPQFAANARRLPHRQELCGVYRPRAQYGERRPKRLSFEVGPIGIQSSGAGGDRSGFRRAFGTARLLGSGGSATLSVTDSCQISRGDTQLNPFMPGSRLKSAVPLEHEYYSLSGE